MVLTFKKVPVKSQLPPGIDAVLVASGDSHTCIVSNQSTVYCIGSNDKDNLETLQIQIGRITSKPKSIQIIR